MSIGVLQAPAYSRTSPWSRVDDGELAAAKVIKANVAEEFTKYVVK